MALMCAAPIDASADPMEQGRLLHAAAHHQHGDRGPMIPTSPGGQRPHRIAGHRILEASAVHPFSVGFYHGQAPGEISQIDVWLERAGRPFDRPAPKQITPR